MASRAQTTGRTLGEFVVGDQIGEGGSAIVYRAEQPSLGRAVVVKVLRTGRRVPDEVIHRFLREARLASQFDHPFAAHVYASGAEPDGLLWLAMELVRGTPLDRILEEQGPMSLPRFAPLLERLCEVVAAAHEQGIVHRDIKPGNVMVVAQSGRLHPKLLDFGIAKLTGGPAVDASSESSGEIALPVDGAITGAGGSLGSPLYMAPEQWTAPTRVDGRADLYALGALSYEVLTGIRPFAAASLHAIARAHATRPPPTVPPHLPAGLDGWLAGALAKDPADRPATALELAAGFRRAAGLDDPAAVLPSLDALPRAEVLACAPQPIAEAVGALEAARNVHQARAALLDVVRVVTAWLGHLAVAARARIGAGALRGAAELLRKERLDDADWWSLARQLVAPLADRPEVHPVPELVALLGDGVLAGHLGALFELRRDDERVARADTDRARALVTAALPHLAAVLDALRPIFDYQVVVACGERVERWTGARRQRRLTVALPGSIIIRGSPHGAPDAFVAGPAPTSVTHGSLHGAPDSFVAGPAPASLVDGQPVLIDRDGAPVLTLWPLCQVAEPAPGLPAEMFLIDGRGSGGARMSAGSAGFERSDEAAWDALRAAVVGPLDEHGEAAAVERAPYLGLAAFTRDDAGLFVGREREIEAFVNRLRLSALLVVVGPSGAGKSSFVQAGVLPALPAGHREIVVRPGRAPLDALATRLERDLGLPGLAAALDDDPASLGARLRAAAVAAPIVLYVDQLEEVFTLCPEPAARQRFAAALASAARSADDPVRVVVSLRDDFLIRTHELAALRDRLGHALHLLGTPATDDLIRMLVEPARRAGYQFDAAELPRRMVEEVRDRPGALPLLSFTAARLWELRDRQLRLLSSKACDALGGVSGALAQHAEALLAAMPAERRVLVREAFRHLVTAEGTRAVLSRAELLELLAPADPGGHGEAVVEQLIAARLLVAADGEDGDERIEVIHEALIVAWPRLVGWRQQDAEGAQLRDQLRAAARQWQERGRPRGLLWRDDALLEYQRWRARTPGGLTRLEEEFASAGVDQARGGRRLRRMLVAGAFLALAAGTVVLLVQTRRTERERRRADDARALAQASAAMSQQRMLELYVEQGRLALVGGDPLRAMAYLAEAYQQGGDDAALRFLSARATEALTPLPRRAPHRERLMWAAWSPDGARLLTTSAGGEARLWDDRGTAIATLRERGAEQLFAEFSADGRHALTLGNEPLVRLWDAATGAAAGELAGDKTLRDARLSPDGGRVATCGDDAVARIWDRATATVVVEIALPGPGARACRWSPDGRRLAIAGGPPRAGWVRIADPATGRPLGDLGHDLVTTVAFSPDGATLVSAGRGDAGRLWTVDDGRLAAELIGHADPIVDVGWSPDSQRLVTASRDGTARLWDRATGRPTTTLRGHRDGVTSASFSPDGSGVLTTSTDGTARLWTISGTPARTFYGHTTMIPRGAFHPDGKRVVTAGWDRAALIWEIRPGWLTAIRGDVRYHAAALSPDGRTVIAGAGDGRLDRFDAATGAPTVTFDLGSDEWSLTDDGARIAVVTAGVVELRDATTGRAVQRLDGPPATSASLRRDGGQAVTMQADGAIGLWDVATATLQHTVRPEPRLTTTARITDDGGALVGYRGDELVVWDAGTGALRHQLRGHDGHIYDLGLCATGRRAATVSNDRTARVWDLDSGALIATMSGHSNVTLEASFSPDCSLLATASADGTVRVWEVATARELASLDVLAAGVATVAFSGDGRRLVTCDRDGALAVWELPIEERPGPEIVAWARCHVPYLADRDHLEAATPDPTRCR